MERVPHEGGEMVARAARAVLGAFRAWCAARYNHAIQQPAFPSAGQRALARHLASR
jgi:hypothetical protein